MATAVHEDLFPPLSAADADELERRWENNRRTVARGGRPSSRSDANRPPSTSDASPTSPRTRRSSTSNRKASRSSGGVASALKFSADDGAGLVLGLFGYALGINYFRYGWAGVTGWLSAKFLNRPTIGAASSKATAPASPPAAGTPGSLAPRPANPSTGAPSSPPSTREGYLRGAP